MFQHEDEFCCKDVSVFSNNILKFEIRVLLCQNINVIEITLNETHDIDYLIIDIFHETINNIGYFDGGDVHQVCHSD